LHVERFVGSGTGALATDTAFTVETRDGTEVEVAADETILAAMIRCGIPALNSCQEGICGTCETAVIEGVPLHRDHLLSDEERASNETMMICVSRCVGNRLVLDL
jgi:ferredoxin